VWIDVLALYVRLVRAGFDRHASYGAASLAGMFTNVVFGMLRAGVLLAVLGGSGSSGTVAGYDTATTVTYVWLGQGLLAVVSLWTDGELASRVRTGDIALDLARPWNLQAAIAATDNARMATAGGMVMSVDELPALSGPLSIAPAPSMRIGAGSAATEAATAGLTTTGAGVTTVGGAAAGGGVTTAGRAGGGGATATTGRGGATTAGLLAASVSAFFRSRIAFRASPGFEIFDRSIFFACVAAAAAFVALAPPFRNARTRSASSSSIELECVFFSATPTAVRASRMDLLFTSSSRARSLIRTLLNPPP